MTNDKLKQTGLTERFLLSRLARSIFRIHMGCSLVRSWSLDVQMPTESSFHLFDYILYRKTNKGEPFNEWFKTRELLDS
jgi:hypothetical protein